MVSFTFERGWQSWLEERLEFPFRAVIPDAPIGGTGSFEITGVMVQSAERARELGMYQHVPVRRGVQMVGVTETGVK